MSQVRPSLFGPLALIVIGIVLLLHNLVPEYSLWAVFLDHWPWFLVAWGGAHLVQHLFAFTRGVSGPRRLGAGAVVFALLLCIAGQTGRAVRANDGVVFRGFGVRVRVSDPAFKRAEPPRDPSRAPSRDHP